MGIDAVNEDTPFAALRELKETPQWRLELETLRPTSLGRRRPISNATKSDASRIGSEILTNEHNLKALRETTSTALAQRYIKDFLIRLLKELYVPIHRILCGRNAKSSLTSTALIGAQISALSQLFVDYLNISAVTALGLATLFVVGIVRSFQGTFCQLSKEQVIDKLNL